MEEHLLDPLLVLEELDVVDEQQVVRAVALLEALDPLVAQRVDEVVHARAVLAVPDHEGRRALARKIVQKGMSVRAAERAARWAGAKTKQRRQQAKLDPALVARAKTAADRITGSSSRIVSNRLEITFADETELEELVEALERAAP